MASTLRDLLPEPSPGPSPARLWCLTVGGFLLFTGIVGFFYTADFNTGDSVRITLEYGVMATNGWDNIALILLGMPLLLSARDYARLGALGGAIGLSLVVVLGIAALGDNGISGVAENDVLIGALPVATFDVALYAVFALLGFLAWGASKDNEHLTTD